MLMHTSQADSKPKDSSAINAGKLEDTAFLSGSIKEWWVLRAMRPVEDLCVKARLTPNQITIMGFLITIVSAVLLAMNHLIWGGWVMIVAGCCDFLDGRLARRLNIQSQSGAFFDSAMDRYMDAATLFGLAYLFHDSWVLILVYLAFLGSITTSYFRAKSESLGIPNSEGSMQRPERIVYIAIGSILSGHMSIFWYPFSGSQGDLPPVILILALGIIAFMSNKVALQRFKKTFDALRLRDN